MILLDGKNTSQKRIAALREKVSSIFKTQSIRPGLAVIRIGDDPASKIYVQKKIKTCEETGFFSKEIHLSESETETKILQTIQALNSDPLIHGILLQLPLPKHLNSQNLLDAISADKDVDGFHPLNRGKLLSQRETFVPCTPLGIMNLLDDHNIQLAGKRAVVIGRSAIVGRPMSLLLDFAGCTVSVLHSQTKDFAPYLKDADIVVVAVGKPKFLGPENLKKDVVLVDVGINRLADGKIVGDIDSERVKSIASAITPVPGGVGPMTICSLLENTFEAFQISLAR